MTFQSATAYLLGTINETTSRRLPNRLDRMRGLLAELGNPHERFPTVHVGGTSGKGSTSTMIATALTISGKRTGLHTKPHLASVTERARIDGVAIPEERFAAILDEMMPAIERTALEHGRPTYYETLLALAFVYFAQENVDVAVMEVGIGGTLDGTNVITSLVSVITNVGLDHTDVLGDTVEEIATDKAGIAKPGVTLVSDARNAGARAIIEARTRAVGAPFYAVDDHATIESRPSNHYEQSLVVKTQRGEYDLTMPVLGGFQQRNAATAILALEALPSAMRPSIADIERGFSQLAIPGRMEFFPGHPSLVFDIAHNADKAASLAEGLRTTFPGRRLHFVIAVTETKDAPQILAPLFALPASFLFTSFDTQGRVATRPQRLVNIATGAGLWARAIVDPVEALSIARRSADASSIVVVTGSTFVVAELRTWYLSNVGETSRR